MIVAFSLSMPNVSSWDGKWSGEGRVYAIVKSFRKMPEHDGVPVAPGHYRYDFGDGWAARVGAEIVDRSTAQRLRRNSSGFSGYDWMVDEIIRFGRIKTLQERIA